MRRPVRSLAHYIAVQRDLASRALLEPTILVAFVFVSMTLLAYRVVAPSGILLRNLCYFEKIVVKLRVAFPLQSVRKR